jgi:hypothetical protein
MPQGGRRIAPAGLSRANGRSPASDGRTSIRRLSSTTAPTGTADWSSTQVHHTQVHHDAVDRAQAVVGAREAGVVADG